MTTESLVNIVRAHLNKEGISLCKNTTPVDGMDEVNVLQGIVDLIKDAEAVAEWEGGQDTLPVPAAVMVALARAA